MRILVSTLAAATLVFAACDTLPTDIPAESAAEHRGGDNREGRDDDDRRDNGGTRMYEVSIENLTGGQPLSPGVVVTHNRRVRLFRGGRKASEGIRLIAENGDPTTAVNDLTGVDGVSDVSATAMPAGCNGCPGPFGNTVELPMTASGNAGYLSLSLMLICTNDGFAGIDRVRLPRRLERPKVVYARAYDAGTEANDENFDSIVDPCGGIGPVAGPQDGTNDRPATDRRIRRHRGIRGVGDLTEEHAWRGAVAKVTITRVQ